MSEFKDPKQPHKAPALAKNESVEAVPTDATLEHPSLDAPLPANPLADLSQYTLRLIEQSGGTVQDFMDNPYLRVNESTLREALPLAPLKKSTEEGAALSEDGHAHSLESIANIRHPELPTRYTDCELRRGTTLERITGHDDDDHIDLVTAADPAAAESDPALLEKIGAAERIEFYHVTEMRPADQPQIGQLISPAEALIRRTNLNQSADLDKIAQRLAAAEIGEFVQPKQFDVSAYGTREDIVQCQGICFTSVDAVRALETPGFTIVEGPSSGLAIECIESGRCEVYSRNPSIRKNIAAYRAEHGGDQSSIQNAEWLGGLLERLESERASLFYSRASDPQIDSAVVVELLLNSSEPLYFKPARTAKGSTIIKFSRGADGEPQFETNSPDVLELIDSRFKFIDKHRADAEEWGGADHPMGRKSIALAERRERTTFPELVDTMLSFVEHGVIEETIPRVTRNGDLVEFRVICQRPLEGDTTPVVTASYTKVSTLGISANVGLGGHGEKSLQVLTDLYAEHLPEDKKATAADRAAVSLEEMHTRSGRFAQKWKQGDGSEPSEKNRRSHREFEEDYAIDLIPFWNTKTDGIDFALLEIQRGYKYSGLEECDPAAAAIVRENAEAFAKKKREFIAKISAFMRTPDADQRDEHTE